MTRKARGDTIVEVLLAIGIAAFGIGTTYATAQRGLDQTITARERSEALNLIQTQITELQLRYQTDPAGFETAYGSPHNNYCLDDTSIHQNTVTTPSASPTQYATACSPQRTGDGVTYYVDIQTVQISSLTGKPSRFQVFVNWEPIGGGQTNQASNYFRENAGATNLGAAPPIGSLVPSACTPQLPNLVQNPDFSPAFNPGAGVGAGFTNAATAKFSSGLPFRGFNVYPDDHGVNGPNAGWNGGYSLMSGYFKLNTLPGYISGYLEQYPFPGDSSAPVPVGPVSTWWYSNPVQGINQPKGTYPPTNTTSYTGMIWQQTINGLKTNTTYYFSAYFDNLYSKTEPPDKAPIISFKINGTALTFADGNTMEPILATETEPKSSGVAWQHLFATYTTGPAQTSATISTNDNSGRIEDDDFAMTQIGFYECR